MIDHLPPGWSPTVDPVDRLYSLRSGARSSRRGVRNYHLAYADSEQLVRTLDLDEAIAAISNDLIRAVTEYARERVFLRAGVVGWRSKAILILGQPGSGKSELVASMVRRGATYYSDDFAALDEIGRVHPFPRPLRIRTSSNQRICATATELGGRIGTRALPVGSVVFTAFRPGKPCRFRSVRSGTALRPLLRETVPARRQPQLALAALTRALSKAQVYAGMRGEAVDAAEHILHGMLGSR
jgi:hypothetical protein